MLCTQQELIPELGLDSHQLFVHSANNLSQLRERTDNVK